MRRTLEKYVSSPYDPFAPLAALKRIASPPPRARRMSQTVLPAGFPRLDSNGPWISFPVCVVAVTIDLGPVGRACIEESEGQAEDSLAYRP